MRRRTLVLAALAVAAVSGASADERAAKLFDLEAYQGFVAGWTPATWPFCAILRSAADWSAVVHPAAVMGSQKPFAPPADLWSRRAVLIVARTTYAPTDGPALAIESLHETASAVDVDTRFAAPPPSSYRVKQAVAVELAKPLPARILVRDHGAVVCTLKPANGQWRMVGR